MTIHLDPPTITSDPTVRRYEDITELLPDVANPTPIVRLGRLLPERRAYLKLEWMNPFGSVKDRAAAAMLRGLEARGELDGRALVEASSGNTAIALAALAARLGLRISVAVPDGVPEEKKVLLRMLGAEVWETPDDLCPIDHPKDGAIAVARALAASEGGTRYVHVDQYGNADNVRAHYGTTGPEIWRQTDGAIRTFYAGLGTTGTVVGVGRFLKERDPSIRIVAIQPEPGHRLPGLKSFAEAKEPEILDRSVIDEIVTVPDDDAYAMTKRLFREEALIVGPSTGAVVHAMSTDVVGGVAVGISPDSGTKYTSYFSDVLGDEGTPPL